MAKTNILDIKGVAEYIGAGIASVRTYNNTASMHRRQAEETGDKNLIRPGDMPEPDGYVGQSPYWYKKTIDTWRASQPGRGGHNKETHKRNLVAASRKAKEQAQ